MPIPTFTQGYPPDGSSLGQTKATIRNNLDGTFQTLNVDHINNNGQPGSQPAGYHTVIHEVTQTSVSTVAGYNQVFSGVPGTLVVNALATPNIPATGDTQLYSLSGMGVLSQLTGATATASGYVWVGGILVQWGKGVIPSGSSITGTISFTPNFPNNCFNVLLTLICKSTGTASSNNTLCVQDVSPSHIPASTTGFTWVFNGNSGSFPNFFWVAIGN